MYWACVRRDLCDDDGQQHYAVARRTPGAEGVVHSGDSDGDHYCCETDPCADDGASGLFDNGVYSLLQLDSSSVLSPWIDEIQAPKGSHAYKPLSTPEDEPHKPAAAGTEAAADQEHAATGTAAYRAAALARYRNKRQRRKFGRGARYGLRKANADSRPRIGGRFVGRAQAAAIRASEAAAAAASTTSSPQQ
eukprot:jgi/Tetstr1/436975/TSEL_025747.t1